jgi:hypothetical protein
VIADAWGRLDPEARRRLDADLAAAAAAATERVVGELRTLLATDPAEQRATPLQIVRSAYAEPTAVLEAAGVPELVRDEFEERAWPRDRYALVIHTLADLGDEALGPLQLVWGMAKAKVLRSRAGD